jgi:hypothetical protein
MMKGGHKRANSNFDPAWLGEKIKELALLAHEEDAHGIKLKLQEIIPEYHPFDLNNYPPKQEI